MAEEIINQTEDTQETEEQEERKFTQAEVDAMITSRLNRERKGMPKAEELAEFRKWREEHAPKDEATRIREAETERDSAQTELEMSRRENLLLRMGVSADDVDYYVYKITKDMKDDEEFSDAAKRYLKDHNKTRSTVRMDTGGRLNDKAGKKTANETMNELLRSARG